MEKIWKILRPIEQIENEDLKLKVMRCFEYAITKGGWTEDEALAIPFTLLIPNCPASLLDHTLAVTQIALHSALELVAMYPKFNFNRDYLISGGLLHDVGKFLEYKKEDGKFVKSDFGKLIRHPFSGAAIAYKFEIPPEVVHIIATHAGEGDGRYRNVEAIIINKADFITFHTLKSFLEK